MYEGSVIGLGLPDTKGAAMATTYGYEEGDTVRFTRGPLGVTDPDDVTRFIEDWTVGKGNVGTYLAKSTVESHDDWHEVAVVHVDGRKGMVPVHDSMIELAPAPLSDETKAALKRQQETLDGFAARTLRRLT
jgi:hypothetical protein